MKSKIGYVFLCAALLCFGAALIIFPERYINCCFSGFAMWAECVLPSLFPFMIITLILVKTGIAEKSALPLKGLACKIKFPSAASACFLMSICSGYPAGSRIVAEFGENGVFSKQDCAKTAYLCSTSGPLFIIGSVGYKMFGNSTAGVKVLVAHIVSVAAVSVIISLLSKKTSSGTPQKPVRDKNILYNTFYSAVVAVAVAGGFIAFFYVLAVFCSDFRILYPVEAFLNLFFDNETSSAICMGLIEATTGCRALAQTSDKLHMALAGFLITFGGVSILMQQLGYLIPAGVKPLKFIGVKFIQAVFCFLILLLIL